MSNFWQGRRVMVTGARGFLGKAVCRALQQQSGIELLTPDRSECDLLVRAQIRDYLDRVRPDCIIHLAAVVGGIAANRENPGRYFYENAIMGIELIEACRRADTEKLVLLGTICSYPKHCPVPFREDMFWEGYPEETNAAYGLAKKMLVVQAEAYRRQYGMNSICLLPVNLYGPGDNFDPVSSHVIPALIRKALAATASGQEYLEVWGSGAATRDFLYVDDAADAIVAAAEHYDGAAPVNLGSGRETSIRELAETICELVGFPGRIRWDRSKPDGQPRRWVDTGQAANAWGFDPQTTLREGLTQTINWYRKQQDNDS